MHIDSGQRTWRAVRTTSAFGPLLRATSFASTVLPDATEQRRNTPPTARANESRSFL
jgi:hypothetical protein